MHGDPVRDFYTHHPYPPPVGNLDRARDEWRDANRHRADYHLFWPHRPYRADLDILIAGCGTWQSAKYAVCRPDARVTGIDVSPASLDHTEHLKRKYSLVNLDILALPVERATELGHSFDLIVCTGVLHHLADPDAGLRALCQVLKPDGVMYLMVYAPYGRAGVYMLQDYCRKLAIGTSEQEIRDLMAVLNVLPQHHPLAQLLRGSRDAGNPDAIADALLNPRDRSYSVPQLFEFLSRNDLTFERWHSQAPYLPQCGAIATTPHALRLAALPEQERYAAMELWRGAMAGHSVIVSRRDAEERLRFDDPCVLRYVPIRLPGTLCVLERLPAGAAGVLLSRYHSFPDLILAIDAEEKRVFDAIDGRRSVQEIVHRASAHNRMERARAFFQKLYWFDQVVFDASNAR
jgi:SAM-dependent methyltransferase